MGGGANAARRAVGETSMSSNGGGWLEEATNVKIFSFQIQSARGASRCGRHSREATWIDRHAQRRDGYWGMHCWQSRLGSRESRDLMKYGLF